MSENHEYLRSDDPKVRLSADITLLMLKGAGYAFVVCLVCGLSIYALYGIGKLLPEDSRFTEDPTPTSFYLTSDFGDTVA